MRALVVALMLASVVLSGCTGDDPTETPDQVGGTTTTTSMTNSTSSTSTSATTTSSGPVGNQTTNQAPSANLTSDIQEGDAPLLVSFGISASDPDGDSITWTLDANGDGVPDANGTSAPGLVEFTFDEPGNYTAILIVSDGELEAEATVTVKVNARQEETPTPEPVRYAGSWVGNPTGCALVGGTAYDGLTQGVARPDPALSGGEFVVTISLQGGSIGVDLIIYNSAGAQAGSVAGAAGSPIYGTLPPDTARIVLRACGVGPATYEMFVTPPTP